MSLSRSVVHLGVCVGAAGTIVMHTGPALAETPPPLSLCDADEWRLVVDRTASVTPATSLVLEKAALTTAVEAEICPKPPTVTLWAFRGLTYAGGDALEPPTFEAQLAVLDEGLALSGWTDPAAVVERLNGAHGPAPTVVLFDGALEPGPADGQPPADLPAYLARLAALDEKAPLRLWGLRNADDVLLPAYLPAWMAITNAGLGLFSPVGSDVRLSSPWVPRVTEPPPLPTDPFQGGISRFESSVSNPAPEAADPNAPRLAVPLQGAKAVGATGSSTVPVRVAGAAICLLVIALVLRLSRRRPVTDPDKNAPAPRAAAIPHPTIAFVGAGRAELMRSPGPGQTKTGPLPSGESVRREADGIVIYGETPLPEQGEPIVTGNGEAARVVQPGEAPFEGMDNLVRTHEAATPAPPRRDDGFYW